MIVRKILIFIAFILVVMPNIAYASILNEVPPFIELDGIDVNDYDITKTLTDKYVTIELEEKNTKLKYSWSFEKKNINEPLKLDLRISFDDISEHFEENINSDVNGLYLLFSYHGDLPDKTKIRVDVSKKFSNREHLYLYYYNEKNKRIEFVDKNIEVIDGYAEFEINHCSKYILTNAIMNDASNNPKILSYVIILLIGIVIVLITYTLFRK